MSIPFAIQAGFVVAGLVALVLMARARTAERRMSMTAVFTVLLACSIVSQALSVHERARSTIRSRVETFQPISSVPGASDMLAQEVNRAVDSLSPLLLLMGGILLGLGAGTLLAAFRARAALRNSRSRVEGRAEEASV